jgi:ATP-dependent DNA helicase DinG
MEAIDSENERASFGEYMLPLMTLALKQGFGRLIRRTSDRGVVAILDERLTSKGYGRQARNDLPPARFNRNMGEVHRFFRAALDSQVDFSLNVRTFPGPPPQWQWELVRLQDGRRDVAMGNVADDGAPASGAGNGDGVDFVTVGELTAIFEGLRNLRQRIEGAGRVPEQFGVEIRCGQATLQALDHPNDDPMRQPLMEAVVAESVRWKAIHLIGLIPGQLTAADTPGDEPELVLESADLLD